MIFPGLYSFPRFLFPFPVLQILRIWAGLIHLCQESDLEGMEPRSWMGLQQHPRILQRFQGIIPDWIHDWLEKRHVSIPGHDAGAFIHWFSTDWDFMVGNTKQGSTKICKHFPVFIGIILPWIPSLRSGKCLHAAFPCWGSSELWERGI